jgi:PPM family protein phosphatase
MTVLPCFEVQAFALSDVGRVRSSNEDSFFIADLTAKTRVEKNGKLRFSSGARGSLFAVADGMGGAAAGEMASRIGLRTLYRELQDLSGDLRNGDGNLMQEVLIDSVGSANSRVFETAQRNPEYAGMGTTLTVVLELAGIAVVGQVGDSRAYLLREDGIRQLTRDQSLVAHRVSIGEITEEEARRHPERNILLQALGVRPTVEVALRSFSLRPGDVILLCSDGLHAQMTASEIYSVVTESVSPEAACADLIELANKRGGPDNITAVLVQFIPA